MKITGKNESGVVLIAVVAFVIIVSIMVLGIMSRNISQSVSVENQVRHIQAEQLRKGFVWVAKAQIEATTSLPGTFTQNLNTGKDFTATFSNSGPLGVSTTPVTVNVTY